MKSVLVETLSAPGVDFLEASRYAGAKGDEKTVELLKELYEELENIFKYKVCFIELPLEIRSDVCDFGDFSFASSSLSKKLKGCKRALLFGATLGVEIDRYINKSGKFSVSKSLLADALGCERIESLCDAFLKDYSNRNKIELRPRFSSGYGDLSIETQWKIFEVLDCSKKIGLSLSKSLVMVPSKSVTAIVGII